MANTSVNKVVLGDEVLLDLTADTVTAAKMLQGTTAHDKAGKSITGTIAPKSSSDITVSGASVSVPAGYYAANHTVEIPEVAAISVTFVSGEECVCTDGTCTFRTTDASGLALFILPNTGIWTVSCSGRSKEVDVESNHTYNVNLAKLVLFDYSIGGDNTEVTGGWDRVSAGKIELTGTYVRYLSSASGTVRSATTLNMIDLTNYSKIVINGHLNTTASVTLANYGFWVNKTRVNPITGVTKKVQIPKGTSPEEFELDISDLTGEFYIGFSNSHSSAYTFIYECYLI